MKEVSQGKRKNGLKSEGIFVLNPTESGCFDPANVAENVKQKHPES